MQKTKLGVSVGLLGAGLYCMGLVSTTALVLLAGYVLLMEENPWLRKVAVKAVVIVAVFTMLSTAVSSLNYVDSIVYNLCAIVNVNASISIIDQVLNVLSYSITLVKYIVLLLCTVKALKQGSMKMKMIDDLVNENV